jgi:hypothetical protein
MKISLRDIMREAKFKAVLYGFLAFVLIEWVIAFIVGGGWGLYAFHYILYPYMKLCMPNCDTAAMVKYIDSSMVPYEPFLKAAATIFQLIGMFLLPLLGGYITGRCAKGAEVHNSGVLGALLILYSVASTFFIEHIRHVSDGHQSALFTSSMLGTIIFAIPFSVWGGALAIRKNAANHSAPKV